MRIFVSHSHEQSDLAAGLTARLRADGHRVFQDASSLSRGDAYDRRIREEIERSYLFLFLLSPAAIRPGCYALTELGIAERRWPNPARHVLPVQAAEVAGDAVPAYLRAVSILKPTGELVAEVVHEVAVLASRRHRRWYAGAATAGLVASGLVATRLFHHPPEPLRVWRADAGLPLLSVADAGVAVDARRAVYARRAVDARRARSGIGKTDARYPNPRPVPPPPPEAECSDGIEELNGDRWLVCRCKDARRVHGSVAVGRRPLAEARAWAASVEWNCP